MAGFIGRVVRKSKMIDHSKHPCFNEKARHEYGRVHLPVAPKCNIKCGFCNRKYDCANETRPGVTSSVLTPEQSIVWLEKLVELQPKLSVVGIAGPGDPFANPDETMQTLRLVRKNYPEMLLCVATNGLGVAPYIEELAELEVSHVTVTMCAPVPEIGAEIYEWINVDGTIYRGVDAAEILLERQVNAVKKISAAGVTVKVNMILIPGVNDHVTDQLAEKVKDLGASILNLMPLYPVEGTKFENVEQPKPEYVTSLRERAKEYLPQMAHCMRCRADAAGLLGEEATREIIMSLEDAKKTDCTLKPCVAVASREGALVNSHLGEASYLWIFREKEDKSGYEPFERRQCPPKGIGEKRWEELTKVISDCRALLCSGMGDSPESILKAAGLECIQMEGLVEEGLDAVYKHKPIRSPKRLTGCGDGCSGCGTGCA